MAFTSSCRPYQSAVQSISEYRADRLRAACTAFTSSCRPYQNAVQTTSECRAWLSRVHADHIRVLCKDITTAPAEFASGNARAFIQPSDVLAIGRSVVPLKKETYSEGRVSVFLRSTIGYPTRLPDAGMRRKVGTGGGVPHRAFLILRRSRGPASVN